MDLLNRAMFQLTAAMLAPFAGWSPTAGLIVISLVAGAIAAVVFRYTSAQSALKRVADHFRANLLAMRLFRDEFVTTMRVQGAMLKTAAARLWYSLPPLVVLAALFIPLLAQLAMYYQFAPLRVGHQALVSVELRADRWAELQRLQLEAPEQIAVEARVRDAARHRIVWRIRVTQPVEGGEALLRWTLPDGSTVEKHVPVESPKASLVLASPVRPDGGFVERLLYPAEPSLPADGPVQRIELTLDHRDPSWLGVPRWLWIFLVASLVGALVVKPVVGVQF